MCIGGACGQRYQGFQGLFLVLFKCVHDVLGVLPDSLLCVSGVEERYR